MNAPTKANKIVAVIIVLGALATYIAIIFLIDSFPGSAGLSQWLNNQRIMTENKKDLLETIQGNPQFKDIEINPYISEVQGLVKMQEKQVRLLRLLLLVSTQERQVREVVLLLLVSTREV